MRSAFQLLLAAFVLCAATPAPAAQPAAPAPATIDVSMLAAHLEDELSKAQETIRRHGEKLEALLATSPPGDGLATEVKALRSELPGIVVESRYLFEELFGELDRLEQLGKAPANLKTIEEQRRGLTERLRAHLRQGLSLLGQRAGAPPALVVSGGVSLGSYQAGFLYYYSLFLHDRSWVLRQIPPERRAALRNLGLELPEDPPSGFTIVTGASAGSVNALLSAYTGCREPERVPARSLFFQTWNTLTLEALLEKGSVGSDHAFSSRPIHEAINRLKTLDAGGWRRCRFSLGATTTRLKSREIDLAEAGDLVTRSGEPLRLARFTEKFLLTASGEPGKSPVFCPFPGCGEQSLPGLTFYPRLARKDPGPIPTDDVFGMVTASGAFPTAFEPRVLHHFYFDSRAGKWIEDTGARFSDGGIFNNNPLDLAIRMSRWELSAYREHHRFLYFDPSSVAWKWADDEEEAAPRQAGSPGLVSTYGDLLKGFAGTAMYAQLMDTIEAEPEVRKRLDVPIRHAPLAGEYLFDMSGFLDEDFRTFDFHRGMVDAWRFVTQESDTHVLFKELANPGAGGWDGKIRVESPLFECFLAFEQSDADEPGRLPECSRLETGEARNIRTLMAVSRKMKKDPTLSKRNKFDRFTEALAARNYVFRSGKLKGQPASTLRGRFRELFGGAVAELTRYQPFEQRLAFGVGTKLALDQAIVYQPVPVYFLLGVTSGGFELAASPVLTDWGDNSLRLRMGLRAAYGESARFSGGISPPDIDTAAYASSLIGLNIPSISPARIEVGLGVLTEASYIPDLKAWVALRFAVEGAVMLTAFEHVEISFRPRLYIDGGRANGPLHVPINPPPEGAPERFEAVGLLLGAGWRF